MSLQQTFSKIIITNSDGPGAVPLASDLSHGELAINYNDGNLYFKNANNEIQVASSTSDNATTKEHIEKVYDENAVSPTNPHGITASLLGLSPFKNQTLLGLPINTDTTNALVTKASASSVTNLITLSGASENSQDLGEFSGSIILDNSSIKDALQNLETHLGATDSIADTNVIKITNLITLSGVSENSQGLGSFSGDIINDNKTIKQALQELENEVTSLGNASFGSTNDGGIELGTGASATFGGAVGKGATTTTGGAIGEDAEATTSGFAGGKNAKAYTSGGAVGSDTEATTGGAIGYNAKTATGGAVGANAESIANGADKGGGAVGEDASVTGGGFAGGNLATVIGSGIAIGGGAKATVSGAYQIGGGTNSQQNTLQFRDSGPVTVLQFGEIANIENKYDNVTNLITLSGVAADATDLGPFDGTVIGSSRSIKSALQDLEDNINAIVSANRAVVTISNCDISEADGVYYKYGERVFVNATSFKYVKYDNDGNVVAYLLPTEVNQPSPPFEYDYIHWRVEKPNGDRLIQGTQNDIDNADIPPSTGWQSYDYDIPTASFPSVNLVLSLSDYLPADTNPYNNVLYQISTGLYYDTSVSAIVAAQDQTNPVTPGVFGQGAVDLARSRLASDQIASGDQSFNTGASGTASGDYSVHMGSNGIASGGNSTHMGYGGTTSGIFSTHMGYRGTASGIYSTHMGCEGTASGNYSTHIGINGTASGGFSTHMGRDGTASGNYSTHM